MTFSRVTTVCMLPCMASLNDRRFSAYGNGSGLASPLPSEPGSLYDRLGANLNNC